ncbi:uncharacterized protein LOC108024830 [Drosophila biarmipes]|uniref:uncharacterized protein LOC108024830 n=1 Tax=Drosophila biarmipes TaxID=125945 RepID=UPI0007E7C268|nr:uncharacterized protein LOC108024830 [Drosophila biarmipes]
MSRDRGQIGPNGSVDCNNRSQRSIQVPRCPSRDPDLVSTPEHLRPGFRGRTHRYDPSDFGLTGSEEWRHPRMFRNMTYETDAAAMETFRQAQPRRQPYETEVNLSNLPEECLADMSAPNFDLSMPSQMSDFRGELLADVSAPDMSDVSKTTSHVDNVYGEILDRFKSIRERINRANQLNGSEDPYYQQTTRRRIYTHRDPSGHITSHIDETTVSNTSSLDCTPAGQRGEPGRRLNFSLPNRSENLMDESMPLYLDASLPNNGLEVMSSQDFLDNETMPVFESPGSTSRSHNMSHRSCLENETMPSFANISGVSRRQHTLPSECLEDVSQPSFERSRSRTQSPRRQQQISMPSQNLWDISAPSFGHSTGDPTANECLEDISMPAFEGVSNVSRNRSQNRSLRQRSRNTRNISDISAPTFASSRRGQTTNECLDDMTMPSFGRVSSLSPSRSRRQLRRSMSAQHINDISEPMYASFSKGPMTNECLEEVTMPSFGAVSDSSRGRMSRRPSTSFAMPSECLEDMTMPSLGGISRASRSRSLDRHLRTMPSRMTNECLDEMTMPSFGEVSGSSRRQITMPSEFLDDVSAPSFGRSSSRGSSKRQKTMSFRNICDTSAPSFANSTKYGDTNECLQDVSMPSFGGMSVSPRRKRSQRQQMTLPTQNIGDISAPSFASSGRGNTTNECLEDISMPSFGGVSNNSRSRSRKRQQISSHRSLTNECLDDMTMPSMGGVSVMSRRQVTLPSECLNDVSAPSFGRSISRADSRRQRTLPSASSTRCPPTNEFLEDVTMPSFDGVFSTSRRRELTMPSECLEDMSAPSFAGTTGPSRRQTTGLPNECLEDISMPTFGNISSISRRSECLPDGSQSTFRRNRSLRRSGRSKRNLSRSQASNDCLEDVTMPSFGGTSGVSRRKSTSRHQKTMPPVSEVSERTNECLEDVTMPSFGGVSGSSRARSPRQRSITSRRGQMTSECLDNQTMPSFGGVSQQSGRRTPRGQTQNISGPGFKSNECIEDISMPSYAENTRATMAKSSSSMKRSRQMTNECLEDVTMPSFGHASQSPVKNECLEDVSMPSYREYTGSMRRRCPTPVQSSRQERLDEMTMPSFGGSRRGLTNECLEDISMPAYEETTGSSRGRSFRQGTMTNECLNDMTMPSFASSYRGPVTNECLEDISMPSYEGILGSSRGKRPIATIMQRSRQNTMTNERLDDMTMPSFGTSSRGPVTNECLEDISMPAYGRNSVLSGRRSTTPMQRSNQAAMTAECLDDMTMPSFGSSSRRPITNECLEDISMPPYKDDSGLSTGRSPAPMQSLRMGAMTNECLDDMTMPSFGSPSTGLAARGRSPKHIQIFQEPMTNECLDNITMPSLGNFSRGPAANECLENIFKPRNTDSFFGRSPIPRHRSRQEMTTNECLEDMTMPSYEEVFGSSRRQVTMPSEYLNDVSEPSFARSAHDGTSRKKRTLASPNTSSRGRSPRPQQMSVTNECLEDMTMPTFGDVSGSSRRGQSAISSARLEDISMPSGLSNLTQYSECAEDSVGGGRGRRTNECLEDVSAPSFAPSSRVASRRLPHVKDECLEDVSMPQNESLSRNDSKSIARRPPDVSFPLEMLANESAPSYLSRRDEADKSADCSCSTPEQSSRSRPWDEKSAGRLEDVSMPTFEDVSYQPRRHQLTMPCENLEDETQPDFFNSTALPSSTRAEKHQGKSPRQDQQVNGSKQLANESAPSILKDATKGPSEMVKEVTVQSSTTSVTRIFNNTLENANNSGQPKVEDLSMPQFETTGSSTHQDSSLHGFQSMENYRPFDELIYSQNSVGNQTQPQTPQPARAPSRNRSLRRTPSTPSTSNSRGGTPPSATRTPGQPCDMVTTSYPYGKPHCFSRKPC